MKTLEETLKNESHGLCYGNRILLPFKAVVLKIAVAGKLYTEFLPNTKSGAVVNHRDCMTEIYLLDFDDLYSDLSQYDLIKVVLVEDGKDVFDTNNHKRLDLKVREKHQLVIEKMSSDVLFQE